MSPIRSAGGVADLAFLVVRIGTRAGEGCTVAMDVDKNDGTEQVIDARTNCSNRTSCQYCLLERRR